MCETVYEVLASESQCKGCGCNSYIPSLSSKVVDMKDSAPAGDCQCL